MAKKRAKKSQKKSAPVKKRTIPVKQITSRYNSRLALRDLILFALLSIISFILFTVSGNTLYQDTFYLLAILFGFIALAFLIVFLVIIFARGKVKGK
ncbi:hypothetical protein HYS72_02745 [Candidatus Pacearchaeota archaeon]|nr:hypothetical protein [Candidatus Pacearchaeota archaeon]MBI2057339.1 hypothetical protein [Candidatus Pacearchaeota archaeon]